jgi:hypothetical protein
MLVGLRSGGFMAASDACEGGLRQACLAAGPRRSTAQSPTAGHIQPAQVAPPPRAEPRRIPVAASHQATAHIEAAKPEAKEAEQAAA